MQSQKTESKSAVLRLDECEEGTSQFDFVVAAEELELYDMDFSFTEPVRVSLSINRCIETFMMKGQICCLISGGCCCCLAPTEQPVEASMRLLLQRKQASEEELEAVQDQEFEILDPGAREVDLKDFIREEIILELPLQIYCRESCKGLCAQCGHDLNRGQCSCDKDSVDPRWATLGDLKFS